MLSFPHPHFLLALAAAAHLLLSGCSFDTKGVATSDGGTAGRGTLRPGIGGRGGTIGGDPDDIDGGLDGGVCASETATTKVLPIYLAFTFDVSGSMGQGDFPWHDKSLKWDPVTKATKAFFADPASAGLSASLTFFPAASAKCSDGSYSAPDIAMTPLPSPLHGAAIDMIGSKPWRGGTPTLHAVRGVIAAMQSAAQTTPGRYALVLVTDGYPQGCGDNTITSVASTVSAIADTIKTYVIGVNNPPLPGAPDTVSNLSQIAQAGGTERAYIIDTGDPTQTANAFRATIDAIRGAVVGCDVRIPPSPAGRLFDKEKVIVTITSQGGATGLTYDPSCAGPNSWHYDNPASPQSVVLCPTTCKVIQADLDATLKVEFTCRTQIIVIV